MFLVGWKLNVLVVVAGLPVVEGEERLVLIFAGLPEDEVEVTKADVVVQAGPSVVQEDIPGMMNLAVKGTDP